MKKAPLIGGLNFACRAFNSGSVWLYNVSLTVFFYCSRQRITGCFHAL